MDAPANPGESDKGGAKPAPSVESKSDPVKPKRDRVAPRYGHTAPEVEEVRRLIERNLLQQFDATMRMVDEAVEPNASPDDFKLTPQAMSDLNRLATLGLIDQPGALRRKPIFIKNSLHTPPPWEEVEGHVNELCQYVNSHWSTSTPIHLAAYVLWRLNWIHPFSEGNGRTSRAVSYLVLCIRLGFRLPGTNTIPEQIATNRPPYYAGLDAADAAHKVGNLDVSVMEKLLEELLARQLIAVHNGATGKVTP